jgi:hypothetical protein
MQVFDENNANVLFFDEYLQRKDIFWDKKDKEDCINKEKKRILNMSNTVKKQREWKLLFPQMVCSDDWLLSAKVW